jgi:hypothetical protein
MEYFGETMMGAVFLLMAFVAHGLATAAAEPSLLVVALLLYGGAFCFFLPVCLALLRGLMESRR